MKKIVSISSIIILLILIFTVPKFVYADVEEITNETGTFRISNGELIGYEGDSKDIIIPEGTKQIWDWLQWDTFDSITFPSTFETFDTQTLANRQALNYYVSENNNNYKDIDGAIYSKDGNSLVAFPTGRTGSATINSGEIIKAYAFKDSKLTSISLPSTLKTIEQYAFTNCKLTEIEFPKSLENIKYAAFLNCSNLKKVILDCDVEFNAVSLFDGAPIETFEVKSNSTKYSVVDDVLIYENNTIAFVPVNKSGKYVIPSYITSTNSEAFNYNKKLTEVVIHAGFERGFSFIGSPLLKAITVEDGNPYYRSIDGILYTDIYLTQYPVAKEETEFVVPEFVGFIGSNAFRVPEGATRKLTTITIPKNTFIDGHSFSEISGSEHRIQENGRISSQPALTIKGYTGSAAEDYYKNNYEEDNLKWISIDDNSSSNNNNSGNNSSNTNNTNTNTTVNINVTFNANGGKASTSKKQVTVGAKYGSLPTAARDGYVFTGWYTAKSGGTKITANSVVTTKSNQTLYARWKARVSIKKAKVTIGKATFDNNNAVKPAVTVKVGNKTLKNGTDYILKYSNNKKVSKKAKVKITGIAEYKDSIEKTFEISKKAISSSPIKFKLKTTSYTYDGKAKKPGVTVTYNKTTLKKGTDYTVTYSNNKNAGTAKVKIAGKGSFTGSKTLSFTINKATQSIKYTTKINKTYKEKGKKYSLKVKNVKDSAKISYSSSNKKVATVDKKGKVKIKGTGTATITIKVSATKNYKAITKKATVHVKKEQKITVSDLSVKYQKALVGINAKVKGNATISYKSSNTKVAKIKNGKLSLIGLGTSEITIKAKETSDYVSASKKIKLTVKKGKSVITANNIEKESDEKTFNIGAKIEGNGKITYKSSNTAIGTVDQKGNVTLTGKVGQTQITINVAGTSLYEKATKTIIITVKEDKLKQLQKKFPSGRYWNHYTNENHDSYRCEVVGCNQPDSTTDTPCVTHNGACATGQTDCNSFDGAIQCKGFANKLFYDYYGVLQSTCATHKDLNLIKPGDIIAYSASNTPSYEDGGHTAWVIGVDQDNLYVAECNVRGVNCLISWNDVIPKSSIYGVIYIVNAPYAIK